MSVSLPCFSLSTIHFYIILKQSLLHRITWLVWVPYIFTSFSNITTVRTVACMVWVPYIFTSFSNPWNAMIQIMSFEYHTFLHHSQTRTFRRSASPCVWVPYIFTSFSNGIRISFTFAPFEYHTFLHHSQTVRVI